MQGKLVHFMYQIEYIQNTSVTLPLQTFEGYQHVLNAMSSNDLLIADIYNIIKLSGAAEIERTFAL